MLHNLNALQVWCPGQGILRSVCHIWHPWTPCWSRTSISAWNPWRSCRVQFSQLVLISTLCSGWGWSGPVIQLLAVYGSLIRWGPRNVKYGFVYRAVSNVWQIYAYLNLNDAVLEILTWFFTAGPLVSDDTRMVAVLLRSGELAGTAINDFRLLELNNWMTSSWYVIMHYGYLHSRVAECTMAVRWMYHGGLWCVT